jgi:hypothetical protein
MTIPCGNFPRLATSTKLLLLDFPFAVSTTAQAEALVAGPFGQAILASPGPYGPGLFLLRIPSSRIPGNQLGAKRRRIPITSGPPEVLAGCGIYSFWPCSAMQVW